MAKPAALKIAYVTTVQSRKSYRDVENRVGRPPMELIIIGAILNEMWALRSLERIGDHASNIAEHVVYLVQGMDVRHQSLDELLDRVNESG